MCVNKKSVRDQHYLLFKEEIQYNEKNMEQS